MWNVQLVGQSAVSYGVWSSCRSGAGGHRFFASYCQPPFDNEVDDHNRYRDDPGKKIESRRDFHRLFSCRYKAYPSSGGMDCKGGNRYGNRDDPPQDIIEQQDTEWIQEENCHKERPANVDRG